VIALSEHEEKVSRREECNVWASTLELFAKHLKGITAETHLITEDEEKEISDLLKYIGTSYRAAKEKCKLPF